ncbi:MAG TPA: acylphosphatase [Burkholderiales bacterium]|jgi:acylphosphatase|nr:acylphosphatase [Burkholderiales bacterium]
MVTRQIRVNGRVQGVGYRDALRERARQLGVRGWVRNRRDGSVEALLQGSAESVEALIAWSRRGPPAARVSEVRIEPPAPEFDRAYEAFERLPSA